MSALEPGLYKATVRGVADVIVLIDDSGLGHLMERNLDYGKYVARSAITNVVPLIILDLANWSPTRAITAAQEVRGSDWFNTSNGDYVTDILNQITDQTKPARIPEPSSWGVVEAGLADRTLRRKFVRLDSPTRSVWVWIDADGSSSARYVWDSLIDPTLIREGVTE